MLDLNLVVAFAGCRAAARRMDAGGAILNVASSTGMHAALNTGAYGAAKAGLLNLTETLAAELAGRGIWVNAISPGMVPTESFFRVLEFREEDVPQLRAPCPSGGSALREDMAAAVLYLSSPAAGWVIGQNLWSAAPSSTVDRRTGSSASHQTGGGAS